MIVVAILLIVGAFYYAKNNGNISINLDKSKKLYKLIDKRANNVLSIYKDKIDKYKIISAHHLVREIPEGVKVTLAMFYEGEEDEAIERYARRILDDICPEKHDVEIFDNYVKSDDGMTMVMASALIKKR